jgi:hypothetical protein
MRECSLSGSHIDTIGELLQKAKSLNISFPELKKIDTVRLIPDWLRRVYAFIMPAKAKEVATQKMAILQLTQDL